MLKKLFNVVLKYGTVRTSLEHARKKNAVLGIRGKDLVPALTLILGNLDRSYSKRRPPCPSESDPFITPRLVYIYELIRGV